MTNLGAADLLGLAGRSVTDPRGAARAVLGTHLALPVRWMALALTSVLSALFLHASVRLLPGVDAEMLLTFPGPFESAAMQAALMVLSAGLAHQIGRWRGGHGGFADALILMVWLQAVLLVFQAVQIVALLVLPSLSGLLGILGLVLFFWLLTAFVAELHGFASMVKVLLGIVAAIIVISIALSIVLMPFMSAGV